YGSSFTPGVVKLEMSNAYNGNLQINNLQLDKINSTAPNTIYTYHTGLQRTNATTLAGYGNVQTRLNVGEHERWFAVNGFVRNGDTIWGSIPEDDSYILNVKQQQEFATKIYPNPANQYLTIEAE